MKKLVYSLGVLILAIQLTACDNNSTKESEGTEIEIADEESQKENAEAIREMERNEKELKANSTTLSFDKEVHDFGQIKLESETTSPVSSVPATILFESLLSSYWEVLLKKSFRFNMALIVKVVKVLVTIKGISFNQLFQIFLSYNQNFIVNKDLRFIKTSLYLL